MRQEKNTIRIAFYVMFGILGVFVVLTPHLIRGHIFKIEEKYAQSLALFIDIIVGYVFYGYYQGRMKELQDKKMQTEKRLINSFGYIGKMNNVIDIFKNFSSILSGKKGDDMKEKDIFDSLLRHMLVSVTRSNKGFLRFVSAENGKTISEFFFSKSGDTFSIKLSNAAILRGEIENLEFDGYDVIESDYGKSNVKCVLCFARNNQVLDDSILRPLLTQVHLLFIVLHPDFSSEATELKY